MILVPEGSIVSVSKSKEDGLRQIVQALQQWDGEICVLKETVLGNSHDEDWQHTIYVMNDGGVWADKMEEISADGRGLFWAPPRMITDLSLDEAVQSWVKDDLYQSMGDREIYTCRNKGEKTVRRAYIVSILHPNPWLHFEEDTPDLLRLETLSAVMVKEEEL